MNAEEKRLEQARRREKSWKRWGCYLSERAWGTVREDYSADGAAWDYFPFDHARARTFRWNEDGLAGICDGRQRLCFALALWNEKDEFLKERLFGLAGPEGNHGEDVKEYYFYLDNTPTHSYMKYLYKYPQAAFPYEQLRAESRRRGKADPEFELLDTGVFDQNRYFDVLVEYAKADAEDICIKITATNRAPEAAPLHVLPTVWFRNKWSWFADAKKPRLERFDLKAPNLCAVRLEEEKLGTMYLYAEGSSSLLFTENETNYARIYDGENASPYVKDGINDYVTGNKADAVNPLETGTKAAAHYVFSIPAGASETIYLRLTKEDFQRRAAESPRGEQEGEKGGQEERDKKSEIRNPKSRIELSNDKFIAECESVFRLRAAEADEFYAGIIPANLTRDAQSVMRQALAGMLWAKQFYHYDVNRWLGGDPAFAPPSAARKKGRNREWRHLNNENVISMPDKWEYPWYAAWDLAFHCLPLALVDAAFAKSQLLLMLREWYMHPNGQLPAYEWAFGDVNPPVHAWAALRVYQIEKKRRGAGDYEFLEKIFHKLLLNFTWWVNRKDPEENNVFAGGFLGLDNIGVFDRNQELPGGGSLEQSDGTSWMAMYCLNMMAIALELAAQNKSYEDVATKFFEHFIYIADAMNNIGENDIQLWNERDGFFYDVLHLESGEQIQLKARSLVGLIPLFAVETIDAEHFARLPDFKRRVEWFLKNRPDLTDEIACLQVAGQAGRRLLAIPSREKLRRILRLMLDETEFLSDYGVRSVSRFHKLNPYILRLDGTEHCIDYQPGESTTGMFGGNSNWRGPVWFPVNYLLIESLQKFDHYYGDDFKIEFPTGSGVMLNLWDVSQELSRRLTNIFLKNEDGRRPVHGRTEEFQEGGNWRDHVLFYEYFHGDTGAGLGASHQTGWTGLIGKLLQQIGEYSAQNRGLNEG